MFAIKNGIAVVILLPALLIGCSKNSEASLDRFIQDRHIPQVHYGFTGYDGTKYAYQIARTEKGYAYTEKTNQVETSKGVCKYFVKTPGDEGVDYTLYECEGTETVHTVAIVPR